MTHRERRKERGAKTTSNKKKNISEILIFKKMGKNILLFLCVLHVAHVATPSSLSLYSQHQQHETFAFTFNIHVPLEKNSHWRFASFLFFERREIRKKIRKKLYQSTTRSCTWKLRQNMSTTTTTRATTTTTTTAPTAAAVTLCTGTTFFCLSFLFLFFIQKFIF